MLDEMTIRRLAGAHLEPQDAKLYCLALFGDRDLAISPAADADRLTNPERKTFGKAIGRDSTVIGMRLMIAERLMRPVLAEYANTGMVVTAHDAPEETPETCNISQQRGHEVTDGYDSTQGVVLGIPHRSPKERTF